MEGVCSCTYGYIHVCVVCCTCVPDICNSAFVLRRVRVVVEHDMHRRYTIPCTALVQVMIFTGHTDVKPIQCKLHVTSLLVHMHSTSFRGKSGVLSPQIYGVSLIQRSVESVNIHSSAVILQSHGCTNSIHVFICRAYYHPTCVYEFLIVESADR